MHWSLVRQDIFWLLSEISFGLIPTQISDVKVGGNSLPVHSVVLNSCAFLTFVHYILRYLEYCKYKSTFKLINTSTIFYNKIGIFDLFILFLFIYSN